jgi:phosphopantothenoylcysteine synthetase/decarboxylase
MTTDEKRTELEAAGIKVRTNASPARVDDLYAEYQAMVEEHGPIVDQDIEPVDDIEPVKVTVTSGNDNALTEFYRFMDTHKDVMSGDKTPIVVEWARANLTEEQFNSHYKGRVRK